MPFKSKSQQRWMFAAEARGDVPKGTAKHWAKETKSIKKLPENVKKAADDVQIPDIPSYNQNQAPWTQGFQEGFKTAARADISKLLKSPKPMTGVMDGALSRYNAGVASKMKATKQLATFSNVFRDVTKTASGNLADDAREEANLNSDMANFVPGSELRANAETGQTKGKNYRTKGVLNENKEFGKQYKRNAQTARGGVSNGGTLREGFSQDGGEGRVLLKP